MVYFIAFYLNIIQTKKSKDERLPLHSTANNNNSNRTLNIAIS